MRHPRTILTALGLILAIAACLSLTALVQAASIPDIPINNSRSPDGTKDIVIEPMECDGIAHGVAKVREISTGKILGTFDWSGFGVQPDANAFTVLWRPDGKCFAITWERTRGFVTSAVCASFKDHWVKVDLPDFEKQIYKMCREAGEKHVTIDEALGGKGHETAELWLPDRSLRLEVGYRGIDNVDKDGTEQLFWITLHIDDAKGTLPPKALLKSVEFAPDSAYAD
ncbi:MAG TPA: hypothetical protein VNB29_02670 [Chthoniobacterales bacterium]|nr:hypothetical protein [Chthoniobacterales bacterium]